MMSFLMSITADPEVLTVQSVVTIHWDNEKGCFLEESRNRVIEEIVDAVLCPTTGAFMYKMVTGYRVLMTAL